MLHEELTTQELALEYRRHIANELPLSADPEFNAVFVWEDWITEDPEKAWPVFIELLSQPADDELLEQVTYRLELLLARHWESFHERVVTLITHHPEMPRFITKEDCDKERFEEKPATDEQIIAAYLTVKKHSANIRLLEALIESDIRALPIVLEIVKRGQLYGFGSFDVMSPLQDLLRHQGSAVIDGIEQEAKTSVMLRRCLWRMKRHEEGAPLEYRIAEPIWIRALQAAGDTNDYNSTLPAEIQVNPLPEGDEALLASWFAYEENFWSCSDIWDICAADPERLWTIVQKLVAVAPDDDALGHIGAGPLEDLLSKYGEQFIERIEVKAAEDAKFRFWLASVWQAGMSDEIWSRVTEALAE